MATPGRSARTANYQRVETIGGDKTLTDLETGEIIFKLGLLRY